MQTELKRVQKRNKATADELEQELAEQCHREMMKHPHIKKANPEMYKQLQLWKHMSEFILLFIYITTVQYRRYAIVQ